MREALFIILIIGILFAFTAYKYRRQIRAIREVWRMAKDMRRMTSEPRKEVTEPQATAPGRLVNCVKCGTWVPEGRAISLGGKSIFCSSKCLERSAQSA